MSEGRVIVGGVRAVLPLGLLLAVAVGLGTVLATSHFAGRDPVACGLAVLTSLATFASAIAALRLTLGARVPLLAVARVVIAEALRRRGAWVVFGTLLGVVGLLPLVLGSEQRVDYQVQSFLSYSLSLTTLVLTPWVALFSCESLAGEIAGRQIHTTLVKPVGRATYLAGKWLGVALLTAAALAALAVLVIASARTLARVPNLEVEQRTRVDEILSARRVIGPTPPTSFDETVAARLALESQRDPERLQELGRDGLEYAIRQDEDRRWRSVDVGATQHYRFRDLAPSGAACEQVTLQLRFRALQSDLTLRLDLRLDGNEHTLVGAVNEVQRVSIPGALVVDGELVLEVTNPVGLDVDKPAVIFARADGLLISYPDGGFAGNVLRALTMSWLRLSFLAALALCASTFLGFPVASLATLLVALAGSAYGLGMAEPEFTAPAASAAAESGWAEWIFDRLEQFGLLATRSLSVYGRHDAATEIVSGRRVGEERLVASALQLGGGIGVAWLLGTGLLRRRELARVQV
ncbi:MAG: ABC transporter permease subunit [Planctomycetota bacterium]